MPKIFVEIPDKYLKPLDEIAQQKKTTRHELILNAIRICFKPKKTSEGFSGKRKNGR